ncbi:MAG: class E sortase [Propionibacteriales bacterium]|nr:class E sortase [Propionibacteriales bacterium]
MSRVSDVDESAAEDAAAATAPDAASDPGPGKRARRDVPDDEPGRPTRSTGRRITFWFGIGLILAGLGLLGYVAWQFWGTNWVARKHQRELTSQVQKDWAAGKGCDKFCPKGATLALIRIPRFGPKYVVPLLEGTDKATVLDKGAFGHFENTAGPGQVGNFAIAGHRVTHGEPLRHMPDLRPGDKVIVETRKFTYTYVLDTNPNDLVISFTGTWVLDPLPHNPDPGGPEPQQVEGQRLITLTTCSEIFHTDNRMIAFGHLVREKAKTAAAASEAAS